MRRALLIAGAALLGAAPAAAAAPPAPATPQIVVLEDGADAPARAIDRMARSYGIKLKHRYDRSFEALSRVL